MHSKHGTRCMRMLCCARVSTDNGVWHCGARCSLKQPNLAAIAGASVPTPGLAAACARTRAQPRTHALARRRPVRHVRAMRSHEAWNCRRHADPQASATARPQPQGVPDAGAASGGAVTIPDGSFAAQLLQGAPPPLGNRLAPSQAHLLSGLPVHMQVRRHRLLRAVLPPAHAAACLRKVADVRPLRRRPGLHRLGRVCASRVVDHAGKRLAPHPVTQRHWCAACSHALPSASSQHRAWATNA